MTRQRNAQLAGGAFLLYIIIGITQMMVGRGVNTGNGMAARLATMAQHAPQVRVNILLGLAMCLAAWTLGVTLFALTRDEDRDIACFGLLCRAAEGIVGLLAPLASLALLFLASGRIETPDAAGASSVAATLFYIRSLVPLVAALSFAVGSTAFSWLLLRARSIPAWLGWLGVASSVLLVVLLPFQLIGYCAVPSCN